MTKKGFKFLTVVTCTFSLVALKIFFLIVNFEYEKFYNIPWSNFAQKHENATLILRAQQHPVVGLALVKMELLRCQFGPTVPDQELIEF